MIWPTSLLVGSDLANQFAVEPILLYGAFTYPQGVIVDDTLHRCHARLLRHCVGEGRPDPRKASHRPTEYLYYGQDKARGKTWKTATLTLPAALARQKLSALGHWTRDHYTRSRRHPVIDVLKFDPASIYQGKQGRQKSTVRDAYEALVPQRKGVDRLTLKDNVLVPHSSMALHRHDWYDECKDHVLGIETRILQRILTARREDPTRSFGDREYNEEMAIIRDRTDGLKLLANYSTK